MASKDLDFELIDKLIAHERMLQDLYVCCAEAYKMKGSFFTRLANQEKAHARALENLKDGVLSGEVVLDRGKLKLAAIETSTKYVGGVVSRVMSGELSYKRALSLAADIEKALIEAKVFVVFETNIVSYKRLIAMLKEDTDEHLKSVLEELKGVGQ